MSNKKHYTEIFVFLGIGLIILIITLRMIILDKIDLPFSVGYVVSIAGGFVSIFSHYIWIYKRKRRIIARICSIFFMPYGGLILLLIVGALLKWLDIFSLPIGVVWGYFLGSHAICCFSFALVDFVLKIRSNEK